MERNVDVPERRPRYSEEPRYSEDSTPKEYSKDKKKWHGHVIRACGGTIYHKKQ
jgi:hypothetical protein